MAIFKVSKTTEDILKNFAGVSNMLLLREGAEQRTHSSNKAVLAVAELPEAWPKETGIYDLNKFLSTLSMFKEPGIDFKDEYMAISSGNSRVRYRYADPSLLPAVKSTTLKTDNPAVTFKLGAALGQLNKTCALLGLGSVTVTIAAGAVVLRAVDVKNPDSHAFEHEVHDSDVEILDPKFEKTIIFKQEYLSLLLDGAYTVSLSTWKYGFFKHDTKPVSYYIAGQV